MIPPGAAWDVLQGLGWINYPGNTEITLRVLVQGSVCGTIFPAYLYSNRSDQFPSKIWASNNFYTLKRAEIRVLFFSSSPCRELREKTRNWGYNSHVEASSPPRVLFSFVKYEIISALLWGQGQGDFKRAWRLIWCNSGPASADSIENVSNINAHTSFLFLLKKS